MMLENSTPETKLIVLRRAFEKQKSSSEIKSFRGKKKKSTKVSSELTGLESGMFHM